MTATEICKDLKKFVAEEILEVEQLTDQQQSFEQLGIQSLDILEMIYFLESSYHCKLPREVLQEGNISSFENLAEFAHKFLLDSRT
jgi:acyl carrier protein